MASDDQKTPRTNAGLADKTIANMEELLNANKILESDLPPHTEMKKQRLHIEASMSRCRRCGDFAPAFPVAGILIRLCDHCEKVFKAMDGCMWFSDMVHAVSKKGKKS